MSNPKYEPEPDYDEYEYYPSEEVTTVGLPPGQLALLIGVNAVISLIISVVVVLIATRGATPVGVMAGETAEAVSSGEAVSVSLGSDPASAPQAEATESDASLVPTPSTPVQNVTYEVKAGDTLTTIAGRFNVSLFDLMTANGLTNQDFIQVGQQLVIPIAGLPTATVTFTPQPIPTETPLPFDPPTPLPQGVEVPREPAATVGPSPTPTSTSTARALPAGTPTAVDVRLAQVSGAGDLYQETVVILNQGAGTTLQGWRLEGSSLATFTFPDIFLFSGGSIRLHTGQGQNTPSDLYLNQTEAAWPPGTTLSLRDAAGTIVATLTVPPS
ncbi:MAG TPA: LysM peptidoglycan-binding domain-containing protein [Anaerolineae bacterium]|nr:LysM peptidoglycan-binding domain-containing protein [Anaerolineae bacterium]